MRPGGAHELAAGGTRPQTLAEEAGDDFGPVVHEELDRLPGRYRAAVVLCYLEGLTQQQAAEQLGWPLGTVQSRLARGRQRLRVRLMRRGLTPAVWLTGAVLTTAPAPPAVATALVDSTTQAATRFAAGKKAAEIVSASIATLTKGVLGTMLMTKLGKLAAIALLAGFTAGGAAVPARARGQSDAQAPPPTADATDSPRPKPDETKTEADALRRRQAELIAEVQSLKEELAKAKAAQGPPIFGMRGRGGGGMGMGGPGMGMGGGGGMGMGGPPGNPGSTIPTVASREIIAVPSSAGDKVWAQSLKGGDWKLYRVPEGVKATIILSGNVLALMMVGPEIRQVVVFDAASAEWLPQDLREPVTGRVQPVIDQDLAVYNTGRFVYAFSARRSGGTSSS